MQKYQNTTTIQQTSPLNALIFYWNTKYTCIFACLYFDIFAFCSTCILFHLYFVAFVFYSICILAICILLCLNFLTFAFCHVCILFCLYVGVVFCSVCIMEHLYFVTDSCDTDESNKLLDIDTSFSKPSYQQYKKSKHCLMQCLVFFIKIPIAQLTKYFLFQKFH